MSQDEARTGKSDIRHECILDGNHFIFRLKGVTPVEMLDWKMKHDDWARTRRIAVLGAVVGVISLLLLLAEVWSHSQ